MIWLFGKVTRDVHWADSKYRIRLFLRQNNVHWLSLYQLPLSQFFKNRSVFRGFQTLFILVCNGYLSVFICRFIFLLVTSNPLLLMHWSSLWERTTYLVGGNREVDEQPYWFYGRRDCLCSNVSIFSDALPLTTMRGYWTLDFFHRCPMRKISQLRLLPCPLQKGC